MTPLPDDLARLVIIGPTWVGDTIMATPVLRAARARWPDAHITGVVPPGLDTLLHGNPWLDELIAMSIKGPLGPWRGARRLRPARPDAVLLLPNSLRAALTARLTGARFRIGYDRDRRGPLLTHRLAPKAHDQPVPTTVDYAALGSFATGLEVDPTPQLFVTDEERRLADEQLDGIPTPFAIINPGASKAMKRWPADRFGAVARGLADDGAGVVITGAPSERDLVTDVCEAARGAAVNLIDRGVTLGSLKGIIKQAALLITNDTGPRHIALALNTPAVVLFGPTDHRWTSTGRATERLLLAEPFLPEELVADRHETLCRIDRITTADVLDAARALQAVH